jgi:hypothetical protein
MKYLLVILTLLAFQSYSQIDYDIVKYKKINSSIIDTTNEKVLIIERRYAVIYFKQKDIDSLIRITERRQLLLDSLLKVNDLKTFEKYAIRFPERKFTETKKLLNSNKNRIYIKGFYGEYDEEERNKKFKDIPDTLIDRKITSELYYIGADLLFEEKAMIVDKRKNKVILKPIVVERVEGFYGTRYVMFFLPKRKSIWTILTSIGE